MFFCRCTPIEFLRWFAPVGHPSQASYPTLSVEYQMPDGAELEIAELCLSPIATEAAGIGIERLNMSC